MKIHYSPCKKGNVPINALVSQRDLWELHHGGSAKAFKLSGVNKLTISWSQGQRYDTGATITDVE